MALLARRIAGRMKTAAIYSWAVGRLRASRSASLVLRYHSLGPADEVEEYVSPGISLDPSRFEEQIRFLTSRYDVIDLDEAIRRARVGRPRSSRPGIVITFDDGYRDNHRHALPILARHGATGTFYVVAGSVAPAQPVWTARLRHIIRNTPRRWDEAPPPCPVDLRSVSDSHQLGRVLTRHLRGLPEREREQTLGRLADWLGVSSEPSAGIMMDASQLRDMTRGGLTIGAHTITHPLLTAVPAEDARREIGGSREMLEKILEEPVRHFSYPNPGSGLHQNAETRAMVREAGYHTATISGWGIVGPRANHWALGRFGITPGRQERLLFRVLGETAGVRG